MDLTEHACSATTNQARGGCLLQISFHTHPLTHSYTHKMQPTQWLDACGPLRTHPELCEQVHVWSLTSQKLSQLPTSCRSPLEDILGSPPQHGMMAAVCQTVKNKQKSSKNQAPKFRRKQIRLEKRINPFIRSLLCMHMPLRLIQTTETNTPLQMPQNTLCSKYMQFLFCQSRPSTCHDPTLHGLYG